MLDVVGFDMWAEKYDQSVEHSDEGNGYPFAGYKKLMAAVYDKVMDKCPAKLLDVGIGTGALAFALYEAGNDITGVDFSAEMLGHARAKMPEARLIEADFSKGLPRELEQERYDFIVSTYALHHLDDGEKARLICEMLNCLDEGGAILIGDVSFPDRGSLEACKRESGGDWDDDEFYFVFEELEALLRGSCLLSYQRISHCAGILEVRLLQDY